MNPVRLAEVKHSRDQAAAGIQDAAQAVIDNAIETPKRYAQVPQQFIDGLRVALRAYDQADQAFIDAYSEDAERAAREEWRDSIIARFGRGNTGTRLF